MVAWAFMSAQASRQETIRARLRQLDPSEVKAMLLAHVRNCHNTSCAICAKLRFRSWCSWNPLHGLLLTDEHGGPPEQDVVPGGAPRVLPRALLLRMLEDINAAQLLRGGIDIHKRVHVPRHLPCLNAGAAAIAAAFTSGPTGTHYATAVEIARVCPKRKHAQSAAWLVLRAAEPWSSDTHHIFPTVTRQRAVALLFLGYALSHTGRFAGEEQALSDIWRMIIMPYVL